MWTSFVGQFDYPIRKDGYGIKGMDGDNVILASCEHHFIRENENLVQHPSNDKPITYMYLAHRSTLAMLAAWMISNQVAEASSLLFTSTNLAFNISQALIAA